MTFTVDREDLQSLVDKVDMTNHDNFRRFEPTWKSQPRFDLDAIIQEIERAYASDEPPSIEACAKLAALWNKIRRAIPQPVREPLPIKIYPGGDDKKAKVDEVLREVETHWPAGYTMPGKPYRFESDYKLDDENVGILYSPQREMVAVYRNETPDAEMTGNFEAAREFLVQQQPDVTLTDEGKTAAVEPIKNSALRFNVNHNVRVKLTDAGREILMKSHREFWDRFPSSAPKQYTPPIEDADGWSTWQFWRLMNDLGGHLVMGKEPPFETEIEILSPCVAEAIAAARAEEREKFAQEIAGGLDSYIDERVLCEHDQS